MIDIRLLGLSTILISQRRLLRPLLAMPNQVDIALIWPVEATWASLSSMADMER